LLLRIVCNIWIVSLISLLSSISGRIHWRRSVVLLLSIGLLVRVECRWVVGVTSLGGLWVPSPIAGLLVSMLVY